MKIKSTRIKHLPGYSLAAASTLLIPAGGIYSILGGALSAYLITKNEYHHLREKFYIKNNEIIFEEGILNKTRTAMEITRITQIKIKQNLIEKLFNYGNIELTTWGDTLIMKGIKAPQVITGRIKELQRDID